MQVYIHTLPWTEPRESPVRRQPSQFALTTNSIHSGSEDDQERRPHQDDFRSSQGAPRGSQEQRQCRGGAAQESTSHHKVGARETHACRRLGQD